jgi:hypothetical protein
MANELLAPLGPLFGPNSVIITVNDETGRRFQLQVYPDANNPALRAAGLQKHFYYVPQTVFLAKKETAPTDFDFGMTIFKGLITGEGTLGASPAGDQEIGGGFCVFKTTFAIPESVIAGAVQQLRQQDPGQPIPILGLIPIVSNDVTIEVPPLQGGPNVPMFINAQGTGKGSIDATGNSSFLVTMNEFAAGAVGGALKQGKSPFTVHYNLKEQFWIGECDASVHVNIDKVFDQFSAALSAGGFLGIDNISLSAAYQSCITHGGISTDIKVNNAVLSPEDPLKKMIDAQVEDMRKQAFDLAKHEIFDFTPTADPPATADRGFFSQVFGGASVSMKANFQHRGLHFDQTFTVSGSLAAYSTISGDLSDLEPEIRAHLDKYLAIVEIDEFFKKVQVAATNNVVFSEVLADGTDLRDPIKSVQIEVGYPDFNHPLGANGQIDPQFRAEGLHYTVGNRNSRASEIAQWTRDNPTDVINISFLKLAGPVAGFDPDEVVVRKTIAFDPLDPRVELSSGTSIFVREERTKGHAPKLTADEAGYIYVKFRVDRPIKSDAITLTLTCTIGSRRNIFTITKANQDNVLWEIFSDKFIDQTSFSYNLQVEIVGPDFTDEPVDYGTSAPVQVPLPSGRIKYIDRLTLQLPTPPPDKIETINQYIKASMQS